MPGLDSLLRVVPAVAGRFSLHRDCFASGAGLGTIGPAWWDSGEGLTMVVPRGRLCSTAHEAHVTPGPTSRDSLGLEAIPTLPAQIHLHGQESQSTCLAGLLRLGQ